MAGCELGAAKAWGRKPHRKTRGPSSFGPIASYRPGKLTPSSYMAEKPVRGKV